MSNSWFQFKKFLITQENSALKVGTDGVLLGAWCGVSGAKHILDVGTGTGVVALMLAQRSDAEVMAVEINDDACMDARHNFQNSPWGERLSLYSGDFNKFQEAHTFSFDLVVCNPPFFKKSMKSVDPASSTARHDVSLTFEQLIEGAKKSLTIKGRLAVILPIEALADFRETARLSGFYLSRKTTVIPKVGKAPKRVLLEFSNSATYPESDEIIILLDAHTFSEKFIELTKEFYLGSY
ncbi:MAG: methyltransferase [Prolixibacteraceae bacterium]|jgi:tRNA1Val (adenine37-N6)-methyltransferase|nr:methyltransferase [Prolixibacteraceae bacterium]